MRDFVETYFSFQQVRFINRKATTTSKQKKNVPNKIKNNNLHLNIRYNPKIFCH